MKFIMPAINVRKIIDRPFNAFTTSRKIGVYAPCEKAARVRAASYLKINRRYVVASQAEEHDARFKRSTASVGDSTKHTI